MSLMWVITTNVSSCDMYKNCGHDKWLFYETRKHLKAIYSVFLRFNENRFWSTAREDGLVSSLAGSGGLWDWELGGRVTCSAPCSEGVAPWCRRQGYSRCSATATCFQVTALVGPHVCKQHLPLTCSERPCGLHIAALNSTAPLWLSLSC